MDGLPKSSLTNIDQFTNNITGTLNNKIISYLGTLTILKPGTSTFDQKTAVQMGLDVILSEQCSLCSLM